MRPESAVRVLIVGATSAIATETARVYAAYGARLFLTGRDAERLEGVAADLRVRGAAAVETAVLDVTDRRRGGEVMGSAWAAFGGLDVALLAHGVLPDQARCQASAEDAVAALEVNLTATVALLTPLANRFESAGAGCIAVITSVAGDRGRQSNYLYGAAKGGLDRFLEGLRNRLFRSGVAVVTLKPGFVDTPMTAAFAKGPLWISSDRAGRIIVRAIRKGKTTVYVPGFWRWIMAVLRVVPQRLFARLDL